MSTFGILVALPAERFYNINGGCMKKIEVIKEKCIKCAMCYSTAPDVFTPGDEGESIVINPEVNDQSEDLIGICPTGAIIISESEEEAA